MRIQHSPTRNYLVLTLSFLSFSIFGEGFLAGTLVKVPHGYAAIEDLKPGDSITCTDAFGTLCQKPLLTLIRKEVSSYQRFYFANNAGHQIEVSAASDQKIFAHNKRWMLAEQLQPGHDTISCAQGRIAGIAGKAHILQKTILYSLVIADHHNFFVSSHDVHVHNFAPVLLALNIAWGIGGAEILWFGGAGIIGAIIFFAKQIFQEGIRRVFFELSTSRFGNIYDNNAQYSFLDHHEPDELQWIPLSPVHVMEHQRGNGKNGANVKNNKAKKQNNGTGGGGGNGGGKDPNNKKGPGKIPLKEGAILAADEARKIAEKHNKKLREKLAKAVEYIDEKIIKKITGQKMGNVTSDKDTTQIHITGSCQRGRNDFYDFDPINVRNPKEDMLLGNLKDGRTINFREFSEEGSPTLEIYNPFTKASLKFRYR